MSYRTPAQNRHPLKPIGQQPPLFTASAFGATVDFTLALAKLHPKYVTLSTAEKVKDKRR